MPDPLVLPQSTPRHALPFLFVAQAQKEMFVNETISRLDLIVHACVMAEQTDPPPDPLPGQCWLIGTPATGVWTGAEGRLAGWTSGAWHFFQPTPGMAVWDSTTRQRLHFDGSWHRPATPALPDGGTTVDSEARAAVAELVLTLKQAGILALP